MIVRDLNPSMVVGMLGHARAARALVPGRNNLSTFSIFSQDHGIFAPAAPGSSFAPGVSGSLSPALSPAQSVSEVEAPGGRNELMNNTCLDLRKAKIKSSTGFSVFVVD